MKKALNIDQQIAKLKSHGMEFDNEEKAKEILGWTPEHNSLEEIISTAWNWHKNHPNGFN